MMYYGIYHTTNEGAREILATVIQNDLEFPPQVKYKNETWSFSQAMLVSTPSTEKQFRQFCKEQGIETDVEI